MNDTKHTPGPWTTAEQDEPCIWSARGIVARLWCGRGDEAANAALIAAAPTQNAALEMIAAKLPIMPDPDATPEDEIEIALTWREVSQIKHALSRATQTEGK